MIAVANRLFVAPEHAQKLEDLFDQRIGLVTTSPGFIKNYVLRPKKGEDPYIVLTFWETEEDVEVWMHSDAFKKAHVREMPLDGYVGPNHVEMFDIVIESDPQT